MKQPPIILTEGEKRVVMLLMLGYSYKRIAFDLAISETAIKQCVSRMGERTGYHGSRELLCAVFWDRIRAVEANAESAVIASLEVA